MAGIGIVAMTIALLWVLAFIIPAFSFGMPVAHAPYVLIPAFAMQAGLTDRHAGRRIIIWLGLVLLYELMYHVPPGMLAAPVLFLSGLHVAGARLIRTESSRVRQITIPVILRSFTGAVLWMLGLVLGSAVWATLMAGDAPLSFSSLYTVWWYQGALAGAIGALAVVLFVLFIDRRRNIRTVFSDDAIIQAHNVSD